MVRYSFLTLACGIALGFSALACTPANSSGESDLLDKDYTVNTPPRPEREIQNDFVGHGEWITTITQDCVWHDFYIDSRGSNPMIHVQFSRTDEALERTDFSNMFTGQLRRKCGDDIMSHDEVAIIYAEPDTPDQPERTRGYVATEPPTMDLSLESDGARGYLAIGLTNFYVYHENDKDIPAFGVSGTVSGGLGRECRLGQELRCKDGKAFEAVPTVDTQGNATCSIRENPALVEIEGCAGR